MSKRKSQTLKAGDKVKHTYSATNVNIEDSKSHPFFVDSNDIKTLQSLPHPPLQDWKLGETVNAVTQKGTGTIANSWATKENLPVHFGYHNLRTLDPSFPLPKWWHNSPCDRFKVVAPTYEEVDSARAEHQKALQDRVPGQTLAYHLNARPFLKNGEVVAVLGYLDINTLAEHSDTEVAEVFGPWMHFKAGGPAGTVPSKWPGLKGKGRDWNKMLLIVRNLFRDNATSGLFEQLASVDAPMPTYTIRRGDFDKSRCSDDEKHCHAILATTAAILLAYLKNMTVEPHGSGQPRYEKLPPGEHVYGGYYIDDWLRAVVHLLYFQIRRSDEDTPLDGSGPRGAPTPVPLKIFGESESDPILPESADMNVADDVVALPKGEPQRDRAHFRARMTRICRELDLPGPEEESEAEGKQGAKAPIQGTKRPAQEDTEDSGQKSAKRPRTMPSPASAEGGDV